ncbi:MAG: (Fe-S)-binding protein [Armatimonadetes bacterium]|nr:(Fe-S)-binding protein [Armatimonadota bacterium]
MSDLDRQFIADELLRCSRCGYCMSVCPTFAVGRDERAVARGRNELVRRALAGGARELAELRGPLNDCLLCGACRTACFGCVETADVMARARSIWQDEHGLPLVQRVAFRDVLANPPLMRHLMRLVSLGYAVGLRELVSRLPGLRSVSPSLDNARQMVPEMPRRFLRDSLPELGFVPGSGPLGDVWMLAGDLSDGPKALYFLGCGADYQLPRQGEAAIRLLKRFSSCVIVAANRCCGLPPYAYGDLEGAAQLIQANVETISTAGADVVVSECASCSGFMRKWPELLAGTAAEQASHQLLSVTRDLTRFLAEQDWGPVESALEGISVTFHDPCHLSRGQGIGEEPRKLLRDVARMDFREMPEADWCCGGAGTYAVTHPQTSDRILERKVRNIESTGAKLVCTACPACIAQLRRGVSRDQQGPGVQHIAETLCEALNIPLSSWQKQKEKPDG